jgi:TonB family protein
MDFVKCLNYKTPMKQSFLTQLGTVSVVHVLLIMGSALLLKSTPTKIQKIKGSGPIEISFNLGGSGETAAPAVGAPKPLAPKKVSVNALPAQPAATPLESSGSGEARAAQSGSRNGSGSGPAIDGEREGREASLREIYKAELRSKIDKNKTYPLMSRRLGQTGTVVVAFTLLKDGSITNVKIEDPAPFAPLNTSALEAVSKVGKFKPIPVELQEETMDLQIPIKFLTL